MQCRQAALAHAIAGGGAFIIALSEHVCDHRRDTSAISGAVLALPAEAASDRMESSGRLLVDDEVAFGRYERQL